MNILIIGTGAIGGFYGSLLAKQGATVSVLARSDYAQVRAHGIHIRSAVPAVGDYHFRPAHVVCSALELDEKPDYVLLCVKVVAGADRAALLKDALGPATRIVLVSNGVEIEDEIAAAYPDHALISGLAFICVTRTAPGEIWHQAYGRLALGDYPRGVSPATLALCQAFEGSGIPCATSEDVVGARWQKCVWNAAFSPLSVLSGGLDTHAILDTAEPLVRAIMAETILISNALGHPLPTDMVEKQVSSTRKMPPYKTSMLLDHEAGRPMETEAILGNAVRAGQRLGLDVPHLATLYGLMRLVEARAASH